MKYFELDWKVYPPNPDLADIDEYPSLDVPWTTGHLFQIPIAEPIILKLSPEKGPVLPDMFVISIPLFSDRLLSALEKAGVENLVCYQAHIIDLEGVVHTNYKAVNIIGTISCADLTKSEFLQESGPPVMDFFHLVIDEQKINRVPLFRLAEDIGYIIVSEKVKQCIEEINPLGIRFIPIESST